MRNRIKSTIARYLLWTWQHLEIPNQRGQQNPELDVRQSTSKTRSESKAEGNIWSGLTVKCDVVSVAYKSSLRVEQSDVLVVPGTELACDRVLRLLSLISRVGECMLGPLCRKKQHGPLGDVVAKKDGALNSLAVANGYCDAAVEDFLYVTKSPVFDTSRTIPEISPSRLLAASDTREGPW